MIRYFTAIVFFFALLGSVAAQPVFTLSDAQGNTGDIVSIDVRVADFESIVGFQFAVKFDPDKLKVVNVRNMTTILESFDDQNVDYSPVNANEGLIIVSYSNVLTDEGFTIPDDGLFFTIEFEIVATGNTTATVDIPQEVDFGEFGLKVEMIDNQYNEIGMSANAGTVTIGEGGSGGPGRVSLTIGSASGSQGETVCVPITVSNFTDIVGMQYSIKFDPDFIEYVEGRNFDLTNFSNASISTESIESNDALIISWSSPDSDPTSVPDDRVIAELCFKITRSNGQSAINFSGSPQSIEFTTIVDGSTATVDYNLSNGQISAGGGGGMGSTNCDKSGFSVAASNVASPQGSNVCVDVVGKGIDRMGVLQTLIEWDPAVLSNPSVESVNVPLSGLDYSLDKGAEGKFILSWTYSDPDLAGLTLEDNSILFKLCFDVVGSDGANTSITFTGDNNTSQLATDIEGQPYDFQYCEGSVTVGEPEGVTVQRTSPTCPGNNDGSITLTVNSGQSPYTYSWTSGGENVGASATISSLAAGTYSYVVTDNSGTEIGSGDVVLSDPEEIMIDGDITQTNQGDDGAIDVTVTGGSGNYMYSWSNGSDQEDLSNLSNGTYTLTVTDGNGCSVSSDFTIGTGEFNVVIQMTSPLGCNGESNATLRANASNGAAPYTYSWSTGDNTESIQNVGTGEYSVEVTDADGNTAEATFNLEEPNQMIVRVVTTPSNGGDAGTAKAEVQGGTQPYSYSWNDKTPGSTTVFIGGLTEGSYQVIVTDATGCMAQGTGYVSVDDQDCFSASQVMTPNADGLNDELRIACVEGTINTLTIFDRYGAMVYREENYANRWTGVDGDGQTLDDGVYYFVLEVQEPNGTTTQHKGHITLLRRLN